MKKNILLLLIFVLVQGGQAQVTKTVNNCLAGGLSSTFSSAEKTTVTNLTITGKIDARDFNYMRDSLSALSILNLSGVSISAYTGTGGTYTTNNTFYRANEIPDMAFCYQTNLVGKTTLNSVILPTFITSIGGASFCGCTNITSIYIPAFVSYIGNAAFAGGPMNLIVDASNKNYVVEDGVLFNFDKTLLKCCLVSKTGNYDVPPSTSIIEMNAFMHCKNLTSVKIPISVKVIGIGAFIRCTALTTVLIPSTITTIPNSTFSFCTSLTTISISTSVKSIANFCFSDCKALTTISIPSSITSIGSYTFSGCDGLTSIYAHSNIPTDLSSSPDVFLNVNKSTCTLYVPIGSKSSYQAATQWKDFMNIEEMTTGTLPLGQSNIKIILKDKNLFILNAEIGCKVQIYRVSGVIFKEQSIVNNQTNITLPTGIYVLRIGNYSDKVIVK